MKNLPEIVRHIKTNLDVNAIKRRLAASTRNGKESKLYKMFCLMADEGLEDDRKLKKRLYGSEITAAYYNLRKRLYNEILAAISADLTQTEGKDSYFKMRVMAATHLRNAFTLWQQKLHRAALDELHAALRFAELSLDSYFMAHLHHQILVLSSFFPELRTEIFNHHSAIKQHLEDLPLTNELCLMHYKVRYISDFAQNEAEALQAVEQAVKTYEQMMDSCHKPILLLQILNGLLNCYERLNLQEQQLLTIGMWLKTARAAKIKHPEFLASRQLMLKRKEKLENKLREKSNQKELRWLNEFSSTNKNLSTTSSLHHALGNTTTLPVKSMF